MPLRVQREAECRAPASAEAADSETPLDTPRRASHACPLQLLTSPNPSPNPNPNQVLQWLPAGSEVEFLKSDIQGMDLQAHP